MPSIYAQASCASSIAIRTRCPKGIAGRECTSSSEVLVWAPVNRLEATLPVGDGDLVMEPLVHRVPLAEQVDLCPAARDNSIRSAGLTLLGFSWRPVHPMTLSSRDEIGMTDMVRASGRCKSVTHQLVCQTIPSVDLLRPPRISEFCKQWPPGDPIAKGTYRSRRCDTPVDRYQQLPRVTRTE